MNSLLLINSSGRITRSITRQLTARFIAGWRSRNPDGAIIKRDVGLNPPPPVNEAWITSAFAAYHSRSEPLALSETLIEELIEADAIVRVGRTFAFDADASEPYRPLLSSKPVVVIVSVGDGSLLPGGTLAHLNFLEPHLEAILAFIGLTDITFVRAGYDEYGDDRAKRSLASAQAAIDDALDDLLRSSRSGNPLQAALNSR